MAQGGPLARERKPQPQSWMSYSVGRSGFGINAAMARPKRLVRAELYISSSNSNAFFHLLQAEKSEIAAALGYSLEWEELPEAEIPAYPSLSGISIRRSKRIGFDNTIGSRRE